MGKEQCAELLLFHRRLRRCREAAGARVGRHITMTEASVRMGVAYVTYQAWEAGRRKPSLEKIVVICKEYDVSADWLLGLDPGEVQDA